MWGKLGAVWLLCGIGSVSVAIVGEEMGNELVVRVAFLSTMFFLVDRVCASSGIFGGVLMEGRRMTIPELMVELAAIYGDRHFKNAGQADAQERTYRAVLGEYQGRPLADAWQAHIASWEKTTLPPPAVILKHIPIDRGGAPDMISNAALLVRGKELMVAGLKDLRERFEGDWINAEGFSKLRWYANLYAQSEYHFNAGRLTAAQFQAHRFLLTDAEANECRASHESKLQFAARAGQRRDRTDAKRLRDSLPPAKEMAG